MGFLDDMKEKAEGLAEEHGDKIAQGIDKVADLADEKTGGQHADKIDTAQDKAKDFVKDLGDGQP